MSSPSPLPHPETAVVAPVGHADAPAAETAPSRILRWQHWIEWTAVRLVGALARGLPHRVRLGLGGALALLAYGVGVRRRVVMENLARAFPDWPPARRRRIARQAYRNLGRTFAELFALNALTPEALDRLVDGVEGAEHIDALPGEGTRRPCVVVTGHVGNWELMGAFFARQGYRLKVLAKPMHNPRTEAAVAATRREIGFDILYTGQSLKPGLRHLREGGVLAILADQDARKDGIAVPFFGVPASTALGPAVFAWLGRVPLLPAFAVRVGPTRHRFHFYPPITPQPGESREAALERMTRAHVAALEDIVRRYPEQYFWFHRRWKTPVGKLTRSV